MLVLGVDPGLSNCGYGLVNQEGGLTQAVEAGVIRTPPQDPTPQRLLSLRQSLGQLLAEFSPDVVAVERVLFQVNVNTAMGVGQACGITLVEAASAGCEIVEYSPNQIKQTVGGYGGATKDEIAHMVQILLKLDQTPKSADVSDALAIALCHLAFASNRMPTASGR